MEKNICDVLCLFIFILFSIPYGLNFFSNYYICNTSAYKDFGIHFLFVFTFLFL
jgi:hypothetical protein